MKELFHSRALLITLRIVSIIAIIAVGLLIYLYGQYRTTQELLKKTSVGSNQEIQTLTDAIGAVMELPTTETPTLATVTDTAKLPAIPFFARATLGDKVIIYQKAAKAILYRPSSKKIIDVSVFAQPESTPGAPIQERAKPLSVELRNGTSVTGITKDFEKKLLDGLSEVVIQAKTTARRRDYADSMIIAQTPQGKSQVSTIATVLDLPVGQLPFGESTGSADILILIGSDSIK